MATAKHICTLATSRGVAIQEIIAPSGVALGYRVLVHGRMSAQFGPALRLEAECARINA